MTSITQNQTNNVLPRGGDAEYTPVVDSSTLPLTVQLASDDDGVVRSAIFTHPNAALINPRHPIFQSPLALIDYEGYEWRWSFNKAYGTKVFDYHLFRSLQDLRFLFADDALFRYAIMPYVDKTRRYRLQGSQFQSHVVIRNQTRQTLQVYSREKKQWYQVGLKLSDISAMMGVGGLNDYGKNAGFSMDDKGNFTSAEKGRIRDFIDSEPERFDGYALGDVLGSQDGVIKPLLQGIRQAVHDQMNKIACKLGVLPLAPSESWGMSTGSIVARLITKAFAMKLGVSVEELETMTHLGGMKGLLNLGKLLKRKDNFVYLTMVDGGRANNERNLPPGFHHSSAVFVNRKVKGVYTGVLCDIDISGCYANGLMNQIFPVGIPQVLPDSMTLREFIENVLVHCITGAWYARISWTNAPFEQDLLITKIPERHQSYDWGVDGFDNQGFSYDGDDKTYDAGMVVTTRSVHQASLTHDLLQVLETVASKANVKHRKSDAFSEWEWLLDNAIVTGVVYYDVRNRVSHVTDAMKQGTKSSTDSDVVVSGSKQWVGVELRDIMSILIPGRAEAKRKFGKKSPEQTFLKLVNNTIYGCIASAFFNQSDTAISNVVVGNNITARARALAWLMAKGLGTFQSVTDGGVFDVLRVPMWKRISLDNLSNLYDDVRYDSSRNATYEYKSLLTLDTEDFLKGYEGWSSPQRAASDYNDVLNESYLQDSIDAEAWRHLQRQFPGVDILDKSQFSFESKRMCRGFTPHNKVNYCLYDVVCGDNAGDATYMALRGMNKVVNDKGDKVINPVALDLFDAYESGRAFGVTVTGTKLLSLKDWNKLPQERKDVLLPDDTVSDTKRFYSITPLNLRFQTLEHYIQTNDAYQQAKELEDPEAVAAVRYQATNVNRKKAAKKLERLKR